MKISTVLICAERFEEQAAAIRRELPGCEVRVAPPMKEEGESLPAEILRGVQALLTDYPPANFADLDALNFMQLTSTGYEQVFGFPVLERGVKVANGRGAFDAAIGEWNVLMMLVWERRLPEMMENQRRAVWDRSAKFQTEIRGSTIGLYGYGGIARATAHLVKPMGVNVWVLTRDGKIKDRSNIYRVPGVGDPEGSLPDRVFSHDERASFFAGLDYLFVTIPLSPATEGLIGERELRGLARTAVVINPSRAPIINEQALLRSLREGWIRGASLDVHYAYPLPSEHPLWGMPNVILTPHISGSSDTPAYPERLRDIFCQNIKRLRAGEPLLNELTPGQLRGE